MTEKIGSSSRIKTPGSENSRGRKLPYVPDHTLVRGIGQGSYGEVWLAQNRLGTLRAVKVVYRDTFEDSRPFVREFKGIQKFEPISRSHPGLVHILQVGGTDDYFYYVMELADPVDGGHEIIPTSPGGPDNLKPIGLAALPTYVPRTLRSEVIRKGRLPLAECQAIAQSLCGALAHLHGHGLVHRDIKPSNIIFVQGMPKVADIGLVAEANEARSFVGTEGFIPPEGPGTPQADLYSLGKVLYEISTGRDRRDFPSLPDDLCDVDAMLELNAVILKACGNDLRKRYESAAEIQNDLALLQSGRSVKRLRIMEKRLVLAIRLVVMTGILMALVAVGYIGQRSQTAQVNREKRVVEELLYRADLDLAHKAAQDGNVLRASSLLDKHPSRLGTAEQVDFERDHVRYLCGLEPDRTLAGHLAPVNAVAVSSNGKLLASAGEDKTVKVWRADTEQWLTNLVGHSAPVNALAFSPDGQTLASGGADNQILLWSLVTFKCIGRIDHHTGSVNAVAFSPDGAWLASASDDRTVRLWNLLAECSFPPFTNFGDRVTCLSFSTNGAVLVAGGYGGGVQTDSGSGWGAPVSVYDLNPPREVVQMQDLPGWHFAVSVSPDGRLVAAALNHLVTIWDVPGKKRVLRLRGHSNWIKAIAFSPNGQLLATGGDDATVRLWDSRWEPTGVLKAHSGVRSLAFSPAGYKVFAACSDGAIRSWRVAAAGSRDVLKGHKEGAYSIAFSPTNRMLASGSHDHTIKLWDLDSGAESATLSNHTDVVTSVLFAPNGKTLYSAGLDRTVRAWDLSTRSVVKEFRGHTQRINCAALSPDALTLVSGSGWWNDLQSPSELFFWDLRTGLARVAPPQNGMISALRFFPDGKSLVLCDAKGVKILDTASGQVLWDLPERATPALSGDGRRLAVSTYDFRIEVYDVPSRKPLFRLPPLENQIWTILFSPDNSRLAVQVGTGEVILWRLTAQTPRQSLTLRGHAMGGPSMAFSQDGRILATVGGDEIRLWRAPTAVNTQPEPSGSFVHSRSNSELSH